MIRGPDKRNVTMNRLLLSNSIATIALVAALVGCKSISSTSPQNTYVMEEGSAEATQSAMDSALARSLEILNVRSKRADGRLHVQFDLRNRRNTTSPIEWRLEWQDASGFKVDSLDTWTPLVIGGGGSETVSAVGPTPEAAIWRLSVRNRSAIR